MVEMIYFLAPFIGLFLILIGFHYAEYISGIMGGMILFLWGINVLVEPITGVSVFMNTSLGSIGIGYGAYIMIRGSVDKIQEITG